MKELETILKGNVAKAKSNYEMAKGNLAKFKELKKDINFENDLKAWALWEVAKFYFDYSWYEKFNQNKKEVEERLKKSANFLGAILWKAKGIEEQKLKKLDKKEIMDLILIELDREIILEKAAE
jgi:hypothetical protein